MLMAYWVLLEFVIVWAYMAIPPKLQSIDGGKADGVRIGYVRVICGDAETSPLFTADAQIIEEDTWQVLSADPTIREVHDHPIRLMTGLIDQQPLSVGDVVIQGRRWRAVIYNFDQEPVCQRESIVATLRCVLDKVAEKGMSTIAMPLLGVTHGCLNWNDALELLIDLLLQTPSMSLKKVWLAVPDAHLITVQKQLHEAAEVPKR